VHVDVYYYAMQYIHGQSLETVKREMVRLRQEWAQEETVSSSAAHDIGASLADGLLTNRFDTLGHAIKARPGDPLSTGGAEALSAATQRVDVAADSQASGLSSSSSLLGHREAQYFRSVARLGVQVAEALAYAHGQGVVHRDVKPANLLLDLQGTIWVTDFGLAKSQGHEELTSPGDVVGTLRYMAPERFQGKGDARCDIYSLGVTLYELLTLKPAYMAAHRVELMNAILHTNPAPPRKLDSQIPRDLETIILKAIAKNPSDRFATAAELARELERFVDGRPIRSRRASVPERLWRWSRRNPAVASLLLLVASLTTVLAIGSTIAAWTFREQRDAVQAEQRKTLLRLGESLLQQVRAERYSGRHDPRAPRVKRLAEAASLARDGESGPDLLTSLRGEAIATLASGEVRPSKTWPGLNLDARFSSFSFDADRYVALEGGRKLHFHRISDRSEIRVVTTNRATPLSLPRLDARGRFVYLKDEQSKIELWDLERSESPAAWPSDVCDAAYRPDGGQIAALRPDGEVRVYDLPAMTEPRRLNLGLSFRPNVEYSRLALSWDGRSLAVMRGDTQDAWVYNLASGRAVIHLKTPAIYRTGSLALNRNGTLLAVANDRSISIFDPANGERLAMLQGHQGGGIFAHFEPEGNLLFSECWDGITRVWDPIRGQMLAALPGFIRGLVGTRSQIVVGRRDDLTLFQVDPG